MENELLNIFIVGGNKNAILLLFKDFSKIKMVFCHNVFNHNDKWYLVNRKY